MVSESPAILSRKSLITYRYTFLIIAGITLTTLGIKPHTLGKRWQYFRQYSRYEKEKGLSNSFKFRLGDAFC